MSAERHLYSRVHTYGAFARFVAERPPLGDVLALGATGQERQSWLGPVSNYVTIDFDLTTKPHAWMDARSLGFQKDSFDCVIMDQLLEHVPRPWHVLSEALHVLRPGGYVLLSSPFLAPMHGRAPKVLDYWRFTPNALHILLTDAGFEGLELGWWGNKTAVHDYMDNLWFGTDEETFNTIMAEEPDSAYAITTWGVAHKPGA